MTVFLTININVRTKHVFCLYHIMKLVLTVSHVYQHIFMINLTGIFECLCALRYKNTIKRQSWVTK